MVIKSLQWYMGLWVAKLKDHMDALGDPYLWNIHSFEKSYRGGG